MTPVLGLNIEGFPMTVVTVDSDGRLPRAARQWR
jgi:hypothetical protein